MKNEVTTCTNETCATPDATTAKKGWVRPHYELDRNHEAFRLRVYVPGTNKSGVSISIEDGILTLTAERKDTPPDSWKPISRELFREDYRLEIRVPEKVDVGGIDASVTDGILLLTLPISEAAKPRVIEVK